MRQGAVLLGYGGSQFLEEIKTLFHKDYTGFSFVQKTLGEQLEKVKELSSWRK